MIITCGINAKKGPFHLMMHFIVQPQKARPILAKTKQKKSTGGIMPIRKRNVLCQGRKEGRRGERKEGRER